VALALLAGRQVRFYAGASILAIVAELLVGISVGWLWGLLVGLSFCLAAGVLLANGGRDSAAACASETTSFGRYCEAHNSVSPSGGSATRTARTQALHVLDSTGVALAHQ
jgi:hypothetical protein